MVNDDVPKDDNLKDDDLPNNDSVGVDDDKPGNQTNQCSSNSTQFTLTQWMSGARYDYTFSGAFQDMGSGEPIDDTLI